MKTPKLKTTFINVAVGGQPGSYITPLSQLASCLQGEFDGGRDEIGFTVILTVVEMDETEYEKLPEFDGW